MTITLDHVLIGLARSLYTPPDTDDAWEEWGANCGPAALAAILRRSLREVRPLLGDFERRRYMNGTHLGEALVAAGVPWSNISGAWPSHRGLAFLQITGPWDAPQVPVAAAYRHTHTVAVDHPGEVRFIYDVNNDEWAPFEWWEEHVMRQHLIAHTRRATGYRVRYSLELRV